MLLILADNKQSIYIYLVTCYQNKCLTPLCVCFYCVTSRTSPQYVRSLLSFLILFILPFIKCILSGIKEKIQTRSQVLLKYLSMAVLPLNKYCTEISAARDCSLLLLDATDD